MTIPLSGDVQRGEVREGGREAGVRAIAPRVLVVACNFPPDSSVGTQRTLRLVRHLAEAGWPVDVVTAAPEGLRPGTPIDPLLSARVPRAVNIVRVRALRPIDAALSSLRPRAASASAAAPAGPRAPRREASFPRRALARGSSLFRAVLSLPDREAGWWLPAIAGAWRAARRSRPDVIYSSGPPFTAHLAAGVLARLLGRPWVADFRDPWARAPWRDDRYAFERAAWSACERWVVHSADAVVFATRNNQQEFLRHYGARCAARLHVVPNGCDPTEFDGLARNAADREFVLLHAGSLYGARNPAPLLKAIAGAIADGSLDRRRFRLRFVGRLGLSNVDLPGLVRELGLEDVVEFVAHMERRAVLQEMMNASALLVVQPVTTVSVPGKLYEYLAAHRPILAVAEAGGETADLVRASNVGVVVPADDEAAIARGLGDIVRLAGSSGAAPDPALYDGRVRARELADLLEAAAASRRGEVAPVFSTQMAREPKGRR